MVVIALLVAIGVYLYRKEVIHADFSKRLSAIIVDICNPALALSSILQGTGEATHADMITGLIVSAGLYVVLILAGFVLPWILRIEKDQRKYYNMMTVYGNIGFIGIPVARAVLPDEAMIYVILLNSVFMLVIYTHGIVVMAGSTKGISIRNFLSGGTIITVVTLLIFWFDIPIPEIISDTVIYIGNATTFLSMILLGASLAKMPIREMVKDTKMYPFLFVRMLVLPIAFAYGMRLLSVPPMIVLTFALMTSLPAANLPLILAEKNGDDTTILSRGIAMTTLVSFVTVTIVMSVVNG
jgi:predicted permease